VERVRLASDEEFEIALLRAIAYTVAELESYIEMNFTEMEAHMWLRDKMMEKFGCQLSREITVL
jgi:hypothetical protein